MKKIVTAGVIALSVTMFGCTTKQAPTIEARYYPECYDPIEKLCKDQDNSNEIKSAVVGGLLGAVAGGVVGGLTSKDKKKGVIAGAVTGAVVGAAAGFFKARLEKIHDQEQRLAEYQNILGERAANWDLERASVEKAYDCYDEQINILKDLIRNKKISEEEFIDRAKEIKAGLDNINTYWADAKNRMESELGDGQSFLAEEEAKAAELAAAKKKTTQQKIKNSLAKTADIKKKNTAANNKIDNKGKTVNKNLENLLASKLERKDVNEQNTASVTSNVEFLASL